MTIQLDSGIIAIGLHSGSIMFFAATNLDEPYLSFQVDKFPIYSLLQIADDQLICSSGPHLFLLFDSKKNGNFEKKESLGNENLLGNINKILLMYDKSILIADDKYISLFQKEKNILNLKKHFKVNSPIMNLYSIQSTLLLAIVPSFQKVLFLDPEKLIKTYEIQNMKFYEGIKYDNIICRISKDLILIGGCLGYVYLINLKYKQLIAHASIRFKNEIITCVYLIKNGDIVCGTSMIEKDRETQQEYICSNLAQSVSTSEEVTCCRTSVTGSSESSFTDCTVSVKSASASAAFAFSDTGSTFPFRRFSAPGTAFCFFTDPKGRKAVAPPIAFGSEKAETAEKPCISSAPNASNASTLPVESGSTLPSEAAAPSTS